MIHRWFTIPLWLRILGGLLVGVLTGLFWPAAIPWIGAVGELFVRLIRMLVVPIVFVSIASGVTALADPRRLGSVGGRTVLLFAFTTACAVSIGMVLGLLIEPGIGTALGKAVPHALGEAKSLHDQLIGIVPVNIVQSLAEGDMLAIIFFAMLFGFGVILAGDEGRPMANMLQSSSRVLFHLVRVVMEITPFGVLALIAKAVADNGVAVFTNIGWLALCVLLGVIAQIIFIHLPLIRLVARLSIRRFFQAAVDPLLVAFSTASSAATLPVALRVAQAELHLDCATASTVLPIGASIGKDGTAMYVGLLSIFRSAGAGRTPRSGNAGDYATNRRIGRVRNRADPVCISVHAGRCAVGCRRFAGTDGACGRLRPAV